jgi:opacity protein-like surface antigen
MTIMKKLIVIVVYCIGIQVYAQKPNRIELGVFHPLAIGDNFLEQGYNGFIGVDAKFVYAKPGILRCKIGADASWIKDDGVLAAADNIYKVTPKLVFGLAIPIVKLEPYANLGYGFYFVNGQNGNGNSVSFEDDVLDGFTIGLGINWTIAKWFYIDANYQFSKINQDTFDSAFYENIEFINIGVGIRL